DGKHVAPPVLFALAMLIKPQSLLFAPLGLFAILFGLVADASSPKKALGWTAAGLAAAGALAGGVAVLANAGMDAPAWGWALLAVAALACAGLFTYGVARGSRPVRGTLIGLAAALGLVYLAALVSAFDASQGVGYLLWYPIE